MIMRFNVVLETAEESGYTVFVKEEIKERLRRPWNDTTIIPKSINGRTDDPRVDKPWDWLAAHNKQP